MKTVTILFLLLNLVAFSTAYEWEAVDPPGHISNNYVLWGGGLIYEIVCTPTSILVCRNGSDWEEYSHAGLPCWDAEQIFMATADLMVVMGDGSYSDGIYLFSFISNQFTVSEWMYKPHFIYYCWNDYCFYVGGEQGLKVGEEPTNWQDVDFFTGKNCYDMISHYDNYVVSTDEGVFYSDDAGENWYPSNSNYLISDMAISQADVIYGVFPGISNSSGLYSSQDFGVNWNLEFWSDNLSSVTLDDQQNIFVGWEDAAGTNQGVALYDPVSGDLDLMNSGLPDLHVNKLTYHPFLIELNVICCTDNGTYMLTDYGGVNAENKIITKQNDRLYNHPNPFNPSTTISFTIPDKSVEDATLEIYNLKGQIIRQYSIFNSQYSPANQYSIIWNGKDNYGKQVPSGIYIYTLKTEKGIFTDRMLLLK